MHLVVELVACLLYDRDGQLTMTIPRHATLRAVKIYHDSTTVRLDTVGQYCSVMLLD